MLNTKEKQIKARKGITDRRKVWYEVRKVVFVKQRSQQVEQKRYSEVQQTVTSPTWERNLWSRGLQDTGQCWLRHWTARAKKNSSDVPPEKTPACGARVGRRDWPVSFTATLNSRTHSAALLGPRQAWLRMLFLAKLLFMLKRNIFPHTRDLKE